MMSVGELSLSSNINVQLQLTAHHQSAAHSKSASPQNILHEWLLTQSASRETIRRLSLERRFHYSCWTCVVRSSGAVTTSGAVTGGYGRRMLLQYGYGCAACSCRMLRGLTHHVNRTAVSLLFNLGTTSC